MSIFPFYLCLVIYFNVLNVCPVMTCYGEKHFKNIIDETVVIVGTTYFLCSECRRNLFSNNQESSQALHVVLHLNESEMR